MSDLTDALANLLSTGAGALAELEADTRTGDPEALEWALARLGDLEEAHRALRAAYAEGLTAGGYLPIAAAASREGISMPTLRSRLRRTPGRYHVLVGPNPGPGPTYVDWVRPLTGMPTR